MLGRERCLTTIKGGIPDHVPVSLHNFQMAVQRSGKPFDVVLRDGPLLAECMIREWQEFRHDMLLPEIGTACSAEALGAGVIYDPARAPVVHRPIIEDLAQVQDLRLPPIESRPSWKVTLETVSILRRELGDHVAICGRCDAGPFSLAAMLRGIDVFLMDIAMGVADEQIHQLMSFCEQVVYEYARAMKKAGADTVSIGDSYAGPNLISPADYRRLAWPHERDLIRRVQQDFKLPFHLHICGRANPLVAEMMQTGAMVLEVDQCTDLATASETVRGKTVLHGNIDPERCMFATPEEIRHLTQQAIRDMDGGRGLIVGPGCALGGSTPPENIAALVQAAHEFGTFD